MSKHQLEIILGFTAACCTTISFVPQAIRTIVTKDTSGISLPMYVLFTTGVFLWLLYGIIKNEQPIIVANGITIVFSAIILVYKLKHK